MYSLENIPNLQRCLSIINTQIQGSIMLDKAGAWKTLHMNMGYYGTTGICKKQTKWSVQMRLLQHLLCVLFKLKKQLFTGRAAFVADRRGFASASGNPVISE